MEKIKINEENLQIHLNEFHSKYGSLKELSKVIDNVTYDWLLCRFDQEEASNKDDSNNLVALRCVRDFFTDIESEDGIMSPTLENLKR